MILILNYCARVLCLLLYALAGAAPLLGLPDCAAWTVRALALAVLLAHALELLLFFPRVRRYRGALALSILLTMLFGLFHWLPLKARP